MKPDTARHAQATPADNVVPAQDRRDLGDLFSLLGNERLKEALADLEPIRRPSTKA
jgi:hypothetical protein